ncbi:unnamed protein product, partial [Amoebophrya sp. A25]
VTPKTSARGEAKHNQLAASIRGMLEGDRLASSPPHSAPLAGKIAATPSTTGLLMTDPTSNKPVISSTSHQPNKT